MKFRWILMAMVVLASACSEEPAALIGFKNGEKSSVSVPFGIEQNYPNPFNPTTTIRYMVNEATDVRIRVWTADWQVVRTLVDGTTEAGYHSIHLDAHGMASGEYFYTMEAEGVTLMRRMELIK